MVINYSLPLIPKKKEKKLVDAENNTYGIGRSSSEY